ncbi:general stress protein [Paenibacillus mesotrionivorans]|jgi:hypothetical protein|uniref:General stress protein n=1 Tax=Paenibacillus mesotrionivorans TaxID=3160968 RepID=A0ACC7NRU0_9BACL
MTIKLVRNEEEANDFIRQLTQEGYHTDSIYALAYNTDRTDAIAENTEINKVGMTEQGIIQTVANIFRSRGDELIAKMKSLGVSETDAAHYERMLAAGDILVLTWPAEIEAGPQDSGIESERPPEKDNVLTPPVVNPLLFAGSPEDRLR